MLWYNVKLQGGWKVAELRSMRTKPSTFLNNLNCHLVYVNSYWSRLAVTKLREIWPTVKFMTNAKTPFQQHTLSHYFSLFSFSPSRSCPATISTCHNPYKRFDFSVLSIIE
jgi:hypothetical protein